LGIGEPGEGEWYGWVAMQQRYKGETCKRLAFNCWERVAE